MEENISIIKTNLIKVPRVQIVYRRLGTWRPWATFIHTWCDVVLVFFYWFPTFATKESRIIFQFHLLCQPVNWPYSIHPSLLRSCTGSGREEGSKRIWNQLQSNSTFAGVLHKSHWMTCDGHYVFKPLKWHFKKTSLKISFLSLFLLNIHIQNSNRNQRPLVVAYCVQRTLGSSQAHMGVKLASELWPQPCLPLLFTGI